MGEVHFVIKEVPKSWIDEETQIQYFRHGLQQQHRLLLDATTNASLVDKSYDGVVSIIEAMTLSDQQSHNGQELGTHDDILVHNKLLTQQLEVLTKKMANFPQQIRMVQIVSRLCRVTPTLAITRIINASLNLGKYNIQETNKGLMNGNREFNNQNYNQPWRHDVGSSNRQSRFQPPYQVKNSKLEDTLNQFMQLSLIDQKSIDPSMKNLEIKVGQISKQINDQNRGAFSAHTEPNPKENCHAITTIGGKVLGYDVGGEEETRMDELENTNKLSISLGDHDPSGSKEKGKARVDEGTCQLNEKPTMLIPYHEVPKSWIDEETQIQYFRHGLQQQHRLLLDATTNASLVDKSYDGVVSIIEAMTLSDQQSHNGQELGTHDDILVHNKLLTQQLEVLTKKMANFPQQIRMVQIVSRLCRVTPTLAITRIINASLNLGKYNIQETNKGLMNGNREFNNQNYNQPWRHDVGSSNRQSRFQPPYQVKNSKLEDTLNQFMQLSLIDQKSIDPSMKNLEIKVGQISKQINDQNRGAFSAHTEPNPKENCHAITTIGGKVLGYDVGGEEETRMDELENTNKLSISLGDHDPSGSKEKGKARVDEGTCQLNEKPNGFDRMG
ncbi:hypothetical protein Lal_00004250 [Lupinus albus]|nr:hypothetical protein Lal_00004250 [Lupinus albus]